MALVEHAPDFGTQTQRVGDDLEDDVRLVNPESVAPKGSEAQRMCGVAGQVETAFQGIGGIRASSSRLRPER
jgi:hypothetical protein